MKNNIILIGMMGCGKTTIGIELEKELSGFSYIDIDEEIEKSTQKKISEIFLKHGEKFFRMLESEKIQQICKKQNQIISTGGGAFENPDNQQLMLNSGLVIYLQTSAEEIFARIKKETIERGENSAGKKRPLLRKDFSVEKISLIIKEREKNYKKATITIDTTGKSPYNIVQEIIGVLNE